MSKQHLYLGASGEEIAVEFLRSNGYKILFKNYKDKLGEIDIIASEKDTLVFVEVKTRHSDKFGLPSEALTSWKQRQISKVAINFLKNHNLLDKKARFDVVSILCLPQAAPKIDLIKNAFELDPQFTY